MKKAIVEKSFILIVLLLNITSGVKSANINKFICKNFPDIISVSSTPTDSLSPCSGVFSDAGSWIGFTNPAKDKWVNGFCGPYNIDNQSWISKSFVQVGIEKDGVVVNPNKFVPDSSSYFPGLLYMSSKFENIRVQQELYFIDKNNILLQLTSKNVKWIVSSTIWVKNTKIREDKNRLTVWLRSGGVLSIAFPKDFSLKVDGASYSAKSKILSNQIHVLISFYNNETELIADGSNSNIILNRPLDFIAQSKNRWNNYLTKVLRPDMPTKYDRIAVKSVVTLISNWRSPKGDLLHEGVMPSHAYFLGYWAWDSWRHSFVLARFAPELAKNQIRAMFDYQTEDGMIIDCVFSNRTKNNPLDSKPPLAAWAVMEVFNQTKDTTFLKEMFPKLLKYNQWWYKNRDHDQNGICEFGSTDGKIQPAKWESGMDNAIRFDSASMVKNNSTAWSFDQESVDLNSFLFLENNILKQMASILNVSYLQTVDRQKIDNYFFDPIKGYYYDRKFNGNFIGVEGCEGFTPMWTKMASVENAQSVIKMYEKVNKFSTYIPFPSVCADEPNYTYNGYWRGPIWLDQVYFGISGLRNYGYKKEADKYTEQVFTRLKGVSGDTPIYENYDPKTGDCLRAPQFSWSAVHLLLLYWEYKH
ncbi:MAG: trehalase family glycosidase [Bacteroidota bacterium]|nr:trehalase family glycosidase [Bacteroidota bacterium]